MDQCGEAGGPVEGQSLGRLEAGHWSGTGTCAGGWDEMELSEGKR